MWTKLYQETSRRKDRRKLLKVSLFRGRSQEIVSTRHQGNRINWGLCRNKILTFSRLISLKRPSNWNRPMTVIFRRAKMPWWMRRQLVGREAMRYIEINTITLPSALVKLHKINVYQRSLKQPSSHARATPKSDRDCPPKKRHNPNYKNLRLSVLTLPELTAKCRPENRT